jgi:CubicO group peptidase (beta-lactamase class C family)
MTNKVKKLGKIILLIFGVLSILFLIWAAWIAYKWNSIQTTQDFSTVAELDAMFEELVAKEKIPGMAVAIIAHRDVVWSEGYGFADIQAQKPVTPDTPFLIASVSKLFTGVGVMKAWEQGYLSLDENINHYLAFSVDNQNLNDEIITTRHLATHTSGIVDNLITYGSTFTTGDPEITLPQYLESYLVPGGSLYDAQTNYSNNAPGEVFAYSNVGNALAGELVAASTGIPLDAYTEKHIFTPLNMKNTGWHLSDFENQDEIAVPYNFGIWPWVYATEASYGIPYNDDNHNSFLGRHGFQHYSSPSYPDGGLRTSANDAARFLAAIMNNGELDGVRILDETTVTTMLEPQFESLEKDAETDEQALFWVYDEGLIGHTGGDPGAMAIMFFDPETEIGGVIFMNRGADLITLAVRQRVMHQITDNPNQIKGLWFFGNSWG